MKTCGECKRSLPEDKFHKRKYKNGKIGLQTNCKECGTVIRKRYWKPHSSIRLQLKLTEEQVAEIIAPQKCEVCGATSAERTMCIDHDHDTKKPRGLLCRQCNTALGLLQEDTERISQLGSYISRWKAQ